MLTSRCILRVELPQSPPPRSEAHETSLENGSFIDTIISLLCGIVCNNEQYNKSVGKAYLQILNKKNNTKSIEYGTGSVYINHSNNKYYSYL